MYHTVSEAKQARKNKKRDKSNRNKLILRNDLSRTVMDTIINKIENNSELQQRLLETIAKTKNEIIVWSYYKIGDEGL